MTKKEKMVQTTAKDFTLYKEECQKWIDFFGLHGWDITILHEERNNETLGSAYFSLTSRNATIFLNKSWPKTSKSEFQIRKTAFHEVCEILLARVRVIGDSRFVATDEMEEEIHNLIRIFENKIFKGK